MGFTSFDEVECLPSMDRHPGTPLTRRWNQHVRAGAAAWPTGWFGEEMKLETIALSA